MRYSAYLTTLPYGSAAGEPCIEIYTDVPVSHDDAKNRLRQIMNAAAGLRGIASYWFPDAPFGQEGCDAGLLPMIEDIATVRASLDVFSEAPTSLVVTQMVDATRLLGGAEVEPAGLRMQLAQRLHVPRAEEVIVRDIADRNITAAHLDVVSEFLATAGVQPLGFLYVSTERQLDAALVAAAKASTAWRVAGSERDRPRRTLLEVKVGARVAG